MKQMIFSLDKIISITDLREDVHSLSERLAKYPYAVVFKNRSPFFIAVRPEWFQKEVINEGKIQKTALIKRQQAASYFEKIAAKAGDWQAAKKVAEMREERKRKWIK